MPLNASSWARARARGSDPSLAPAGSDRADLLSAITASVRNVSVIRFNEYRALACIDHARAEAVMGALLDRLSHGIGPQSMFARIEPDLIGLSIDDGAETLSALRYMLCQPVAMCGQTIRPTVAIGTGPRADCAETALARAIAAIGPAPHPAATSDEADFAIEQELAEAVANGALSLHYQPIFDIGAQRVVGAEALMRWTSETRGPISPAVFVPILERSNLINDAGLWALSTACRDAADWMRAGLDLTVAINVSAAQVQDDQRLIDAVLHSLSRNGLEPGRIELELTETAAMDDMNRTQALFADLRSQGVRLSIDDFGAGFSNLNYLRSLPFDKLKIDRQFVTHVDTRADSQAICRAIVALADGLGIDLLAEGVEREDEADTLRNLGCRYFQGYLFGRPMPSKALVDFAVDREAHLALVSPTHRRVAAIEERLAS